MYSRMQDDVRVLGSQGPCLLHAISALLAATRLPIDPIANNKIDSLVAAS